MCKPIHCDYLAKHQQANNPKNKAEVEVEAIWPEVALEVTHLRPSTFVTTR